MIHIKVRTSSSKERRNLSLFLKPPNLILAMCDGEVHSAYNRSNDTSALRSKLEDKEVLQKFV